MPEYTAEIREHLDEWQSTVIVVKCYDIDTMKHLIVALKNDWDRLDRSIYFFVKLNGEQFARGCRVFDDFVAHVSPTED